MASAINDSSASIDGNSADASAGAASSYDSTVVAIVFASGLPANRLLQSFDPVVWRQTASDCSLRFEASADTICASVAAPCFVASVAPAASTSVTPIAAKACDENGRGASRRVRITRLANDPAGSTAHPHAR